MAGYRALKIKVGLPNLKDDVDRVEAIRNLLGIDQSLMIDANYSLTDEAIKALTHFQEYKITWFEEPIDPGLSEVIFS